MMKKISIPAIILYFNIRGVDASGEASLYHSGVVVVEIELFDIARGGGAHVLSLSEPCGRHGGGVSAVGVVQVVYVCASGGCRKAARREHERRYGCVRIYGWHFHDS